MVILAYESCIYMHNGTSDSKYHIGNYKQWPVSREPCLNAYVLTDVPSYKLHIPSVARLVFSTIN